MMSYKQLSLILTIFILLSLSSACSPAVTPSIINDEKTVFTPSLHIKVSDGSTDITDSLSIAVNNSNLISITGLSNTVAANKTYTLTINPVTGVFSTQGDSPITITITAPDGYSSEDGVLSRDGVLPPSNSFTITNDNDSSMPIIYTLEVPFFGVPVEDLLTSSSLSTYITATFASQTASLKLIGNTLSVNGLINDVSGTGTISFTLPDGFVAKPESITLTYPDGSATISPSSATFTISETGNTDNSQKYTIGEITFEAITAFTPSVHISIMDSMQNDITDTLTIDVNNTNLITITGLSNAITDKTYTLTIAPVPNLFSTSTGADIIIIITNPPGISLGDGGLLPSDSFTITNVGDPNTISYTVVVPFSTAEVEEWLTETTFSTYFTGATYAGQTLDSTLDNTVLSFNFDGDSIAIDGSSIFNLQDGSLLLTTNIADGYTVTQNLIDPDGSGVAALTDAPAGTITITEEDNSTNTKTYYVTISLAAYESPVEASHVTATFNGITAKPLNIDISGADIIISGFPNIAGSDGLGSVDITPTGYTIEPATLPFSFNDPAGTEFKEITAGTVNITSAGVTALHTIKISFSTLISLKITSNNVENSPLFIESGATVRIKDLGACNLLPPLAIEMVGNSSATVRGFPKYFDRRKDTTTGSHPYTVNRVLIIEDATGVLDDNFTVSIEDFPACDDVRDFTYRNGSDADNAIEIDSAPKLELISHLVSLGSSDQTIYAISFYKLTDDIDLGSADLPWSEEASGETGEGFPPIGVNETTFNGTFDCDGKTISNLYINKATSNDIGLFGISRGARIQNCRLVDVNVTGKDNVGGLAGSLYFSSRIENSYATGDVEGTNNVGGLAGILSGYGLGTSSITDSYATGSVMGTGTNVGGLAGFLQSFSSIENSYATSSVTGTENIGGLAGYILYTSRVTNSYATGTITGTGTNVGGLVGWLVSASMTNSYATGKVEGTNNVGGLAGQVHQEASITDSYAIGDVEGTGTNVGGLVGILSGNRLGTSSITNSYATGTIRGTERVGGLAGRLYDSSITNSYATGSVSGTGDDVGGLVGSLYYSSSIENSYATGNVSGTGTNVGGLVGILSGTSSGTSSITNSYATGTITGTERVGGLAGYLQSFSSITNSYATGDVEGTERVGGLVGILSGTSSGTSSITKSYTTGDVEGTNNIGLFIGYNGNASGTITIVYTGVTDSYYNNEAVLTESGTTIAAKGVGSDGDTDDTTTMNLTGLRRSDLRVSKGTTAGEPYYTWLEADWLFMAGQYPRLILVACPNRQYPTDPSDVPTECTDL